MYRTNCPPSSNSLSSTRFRDTLYNIVLWTIGLLTIVLYFVCVIFIPFYLGRFILNTTHIGIPLSAGAITINLFAWLVGLLGVLVGYLVLVLSPLFYLIPRRIGYRVFKYISRFKSIINR